MSTTEPENTSPTAGLTSLPRLEDLPQTEDGGYDVDAVRVAFDSFRRHALQIQTRLRVLQAAGKGTSADATGHAVRMDSLHLIRAAAEFADALERDAQTASAKQFERTEVEISRRQHELRQREREVDRLREETERQRIEIVNATKSETRELLAASRRDAATELREAEARGTRLLEHARHSATELTNATRAEVEQTLEWARSQAGVILARAQTGAEQLLTAAGLGSEALAEISSSIVTAAQASTDLARSRSGGGPPLAPPREREQEPRMTAVPEQPAANASSPDDTAVVSPPVSPPVPGAPVATENQPSPGQDEDAS
jgi:hypothetical protein